MSRSLFRGQMSGISIKYSILCFTWIVLYCVVAVLLLLCCVVLLLCCCCVSVLAVRLCNTESLMEELMKQTSGQFSALFSLYWSPIISSKSTRSDWWDMLFLYQQIIYESNQTAAVILSNMSPAVLSNSSSASEASEPERRLNVRLEELNTNTRGDWTNRSVISRSWWCVYFDHISSPSSLSSADSTRPTAGRTEPICWGRTDQRRTRWNIHSSIQITAAGCFCQSHADCDFIDYWLQIRYWSLAADWTPASFTWTSWGESVQVSHMMWWHQQSF